MVPPDIEISYTAEELSEMTMAELIRELAEQFGFDAEAFIDEDGAIDPSGLGVD